MDTLSNNSTLQRGKYRIVSFISSGGFGNTYEAIDVDHNKKIAIKEFFMKDSCNRDETTNRVIVATKAKEEQVTRMKNKFMKEACALQNLSHPNIVHVENAFEENATAYYVMDYIEGTSLNDIIKVAGSLSETKALDYIKQIADALSYVHSKNILHLDVKPGNIMVDKNGKAILIDFGASKQYDEVTGENTSTLLGINTTGYAPAEQSYRGFVQFVPSTDIYALGATLYKLLTGTTPPDAQMLKDGEAELAPLPSNISVSVKNAVREAMRPLRKDRPQSVDEFLRIVSSVDNNCSTINENSANDNTIIDGQPSSDVKIEKKKTTKRRKKQMETPSSTSRREKKTNLSPSKRKIGCCIISALVVLVFIIIWGSNQSTNGGLMTIYKEVTNQNHDLKGNRVVNKKFKDSTGETFTYTGEVVNGKPNGMGKGVYPFGSYVGPYKNGLMHGADGKFTEKGGATFVGSFDKDYYNEGRLTRSDGSYFVGKMKDGRPYKGTEYYKSGKVKKQI